MNNGLDPAQDSDYTVIEVDPSSEFFQAFYCYHHGGSGLTHKDECPHNECVVRRIIEE